jgi:hypothetical protein
MEAAVTQPSTACVLLAIGSVCPRAGAAPDGGSRAYRLTPGAGATRDAGTFDRRVPRPPASLGENLTGADRGLVRDALRGAVAYFAGEGPPGP